MRVTAFSSALFLAVTVHAGSVNFETAHVHPLDLTPSEDRLLVVNTPDALLEVFTVAADGSLTFEKTIPVGLEPVTVNARTDSEAWVVNNLSDSISIVDLASGVVTKTLDVGDEPTDVKFAANRAFISISSEDRVSVHSLPGGAVVDSVSLFTRDIRSLALSPDGTTVYAVALKSGNQTTVVNSNLVHGYSLKSIGFGTNGELNEAFYEEYDLGRPGCIGDPPPPPSADVGRNPALNDPPSGVPINSIIVRWDEASQAWLDVAGSDWSHCVRFTLPDEDLFAIDATTLAVTSVPHLGTSLLDVSVNPANGKVYVSNTDARNFTRFERFPQNGIGLTPVEGLRGHPVDNRLSIVDPSSGNAVTIVDLNAHIDRESTFDSNLAERLASISQPGMMAWRSDGSVAYLTGLGSSKVFRVDGACQAASCIFGPNRAAPATVQVGRGPTGVVLREAAEPELERLYVLNRIDHSLAVVDTSAMTLMETIPLHDPSSLATRMGRNFLYEATTASAHGDAACSSCHLFGDMDGLAWELGNPGGEMIPYTTPFDNVRFVDDQGDDLCNDSGTSCADHAGFDPQKGPMVTMTLRGMLEPLHSRGDRPTFNDFNRTFVELMGVTDIAPAGQDPAGVPDELMEEFRQFALEIRFPPNPHRMVNDLPPNEEVQVHGNILPGNPRQGRKIFKDRLRWIAAYSCTQCHNLNTGTRKGVLGGVEPEEPASTHVTRLHRGTFLTEFPVRHFDLEVPQLRNMYERFGPNPSPTLTPIPAVAGFGYAHDGSIPDLVRFSTNKTFTLVNGDSFQELRDLSAFLFAYRTGTKPSVGRQITLPAGTPPTGSADDESLLATLEIYGDADVGARHCELFATTLADGRQRSYHYASGSWLPDVASEAPLTTLALRENAQAPITFTCGTLDSGPRFGGDRDDDGSRNGDDCAVTDAGAFAEPAFISTLGHDATGLSWEDQAPLVGATVSYEVLGGDLSTLATGNLAATGCLDSALASPNYQDPRPQPISGDGYYYLVRSHNVCGSSDLGSGRDAVDATCP